MQVLHRRLRVVLVLVACRRQQWWWWCLARGVVDRVLHRRHLHLEAYAWLETIGYLHGHQARCCHHRHQLPAVHPGWHLRLQYLPALHGRARERLAQSIHAVPNPSRKVGRRRELMLMLCVACRRLLALLQVPG